MVSMCENCRRGQDLQNFMHDLKKNTAYSKYRAGCILRSHISVRGIFTELTEVQGMVPEDTRNSRKSGYGVACRLELTEVKGTISHCCTRYCTRSRISFKSSQKSWVRCRKPYRTHRSRNTVPEVLQNSQISRLRFELVAEVNLVQGTVNTFYSR